MTLTLITFCCLAALTSGLLAGGFSIIVLSFLHRRQMARQERELDAARFAAQRSGEQCFGLQRVVAELERGFRQDAERAREQLQIQRQELDANLRTRREAEACLVTERQRVLELTGELEATIHQGQTLEAEKKRLSRRVEELAEQQTKSLVCLSQREQHLAEVGAQLCQRDATIEAIQAQCVALSLDISAFRQRAREVEQEADIYRASLQRCQQETLQERAARISEMQDRKRAEDALHLALAERDRAFADSESARLEHQSQVAALNQSLKQLEDSLDALATEIRLEHEAARELQRQLTRAQQDLEPVRGAAPHPTDTPQPLPVVVPPAPSSSPSDWVALRAERQTQTLERIRLERRVAELESLAMERLELQREVELLQRRLGDQVEIQAEVAELRARLYGAPRQSGIRELRSDAFGPSGRTGLDLLLGQLVSKGPVRSAVIADALGFPVAAAGESSLHENLAALAGEASRIGCHARQWLGLEEVTELSLRDRVGCTLSYRFFACGADVMAVGSIGEHRPPEDVVEGVVVSVSNHIGAEWEGFILSSNSAVPTDPAEICARGIALGAG